jgi:hypothetical protein
MAWKLLTFLPHLRPQADHPVAEKSFATAAGKLGPALDGRRQGMRIWHNEFLSNVRILSRRLHEVRKTSIYQFRQSLPGV